jgi:hypothetical protein
MIKTKIILLAENVINDRASNLVSIINICEGMKTKGFPFFIQRCSFFALTEREKKDNALQNAKIAISINNKELVKNDVKIDFQDKKHNRIIVQIFGITIPEPGTLTASLLLDPGTKKERIIGIYSINVENIGQPEIKK